MAQSNIHIPIEEARSWLEGILRQQLQNLNSMDTDLGQCVARIRELTEDLKSSDNSQPRRLEWYQRQFKYVGGESASYNYFNLKAPRKNEVDKRNKLNELQIEIYRFVSLFMQRPMTTYVFYYKDSNGVHRYDTEGLYTKSRADDVVKQIYSQGRNRVTYLSAEAKRQIAKEQQSIAIDDHFKNYVQALKKAVNYSKKMRKSQKEHNLGHAAEAFERHWQKISHSLTATAYGADWGSNEELRAEYWASKGNVAWWRSGDVGHKQVKWLGSSGSVTSGSFNSIQELANYILYLSSLPPLSSVDIQAIGQSIAQVFIGPEASTVVDNYASNTLDQLLKQLYYSK